LETVSKICDIAADIAGDIAVAVAAVDIAGELAAGRNDFGEVAKGAGSEVGLATNSCHLVRNVEPVCCVCT
jgi:hypothetical protein